MPTDSRGGANPAPDSTSLGEPARVRSVFTTRDQNRRAQARWQIFDPASLFYVQERERQLVRLLRRHGFDAERLETADVLSMGCGTGSELLDLVRYGAMPNRLVGADLVRERLRRAKARHPSFGLVEANAADVPFRPASFDLVFQFTLFTSVLKSEARGRIAKEILRVLRPGGMVVWYDFWPNNPWNPNVRGIRAAEIRSLFPGCTFDFKALTLLPPVSRWLVPRSRLLADLLSRVPLLKSHYLVGIRREEA